MGKAGRTSKKFKKTGQVVVRDPVARLVSSTLYRVDHGRELSSSLPAGALAMWKEDGATDSHASRTPTPRLLNGQIDLYAAAALFAMQATQAAAAAKKEQAKAAEQASQGDEYVQHEPACEPTL